MDEQPKERHSAEAVEAASRTWGEWCRTLDVGGQRTEAATEAAVAYLQLGLPADAVAALLRLRLGLSADPGDRALIGREKTYLGRVIADAAQLEAIGVISKEAADALQREYRARLEAMDSWNRPITAGAAAAQQPGAARIAPIPTFLEPAAAPAPVVPAVPPPPPFSLRDLFAENSVLILAALGAFLLVVATVLFELYGTTGLGGGARLAAVVALTLIFAGAGYFARRRKGLESVGQIYIALAAVLLPLVGVAAWTFLALGARGITVDQAVAITAVACAVAFGMVALRLDLRAYGEMTGLAMLVMAVALAGWVGGDYWRSAGIALTPVVYSVWQRLLPGRVFSDFQWFAHASALVALVAMLRHAPDGWLWTVTLGAVAFGYLAWQAIASESSRAWIGEGAAILAAAAAAGPLGVNTWHFVLPMAVAIPLIALCRKPEQLGIVGRLYRAHPAHLHVAIVLGLVLAAWQNELGELWPLAAALSVAFALYLADYSLHGTEQTGYALRAALPLALVFTGRAAGLGPWAGTLTAAALIAYLVPYMHPDLALLRRASSWFFYATLALVPVGLPSASVGAGHWEIAAALVVSAVAFAGAAELGAVRLSAITARGLFSIAWFVGVDALNAGGWRGPFDALLALFYVAVGQARALARRSVATAGRRWFVHSAALVALGLCFTGPDDLLWWRLTYAFGALTVAYWWLAVARDEIELPWLAWSVLGAAAGSFAMAEITETWQGPAMAGAAVLLTVAWVAAREFVNRKRLESSGLAILLALVAVGGFLTLRQDPPQLAQATAALLAGAFLFAWSRIGTIEPLGHFRSTLSSAAALFAVLGVLIEGAVLKLDAGYVGLIVIVYAALHAEWHVRTKYQVERWYALAAMLAAGPVIYFWQYGSVPAWGPAIEFAALTALFVSTAVRTRRWYLTYPAVMLLAPTLHLTWVSLRFDDPPAEHIAFAVLAWVVGFAGLLIRTRFRTAWALSTQAGALTIASGAVLAMASDGNADPAGIALLAYAPIVYTAGMQERERWVLPFAAATAMAGVFTLLASNNADTILYAAAIGVLGLLIWVAGRVALVWLGRHAVVDMHRYLGLGLLVTSGIAGFGFPDRTGPSSLGAVLATLALLITGGILWLDAREYRFRPNLYVAIVAGATAGFFVARYLNLHSWELVPPGIGLVACGVTLRSERSFHVDVWARRLLVGAGIGLVMGWAAVLTVEGDIWWLVALLIEGAATVAAGIPLRSRVLLAGGGAALALASLRALLLIAQAGYLFVAFGAVALVLLVAATALALGRERYMSSTRGMREQMATWD